MKMSKKEDITLKEGIEKFIRHCKIKDLAKSSIDYYERSCEYFLTFVEDELNKDDNLEIYYINKDMIENYILWLDDTYNMNNISLNTRLRGIRAFIYYMMEQDYLEEFKIDLLKEEKKIKETYTDSELKKLLKKPDLDECSFAVYRNWVIINFLLATGVRSRTLINLKIKDIRLDEAIVHIKTVKNRKQQIIPLSKSLTEVLSEYLNYRKGDEDDYLFCSIYGNKFTGSSLNGAIRTYNINRGVTKTSVHLFRHTFAKKWILNGGDSFRLQKILGHSTMRMVREYVNMFSNDLKKDFNDYNPLEQFKVNKKHIKMN